MAAFFELANAVVVTCNYPKQFIELSVDRAEADFEAKIQLRKTGADFRAHDILNIIDPPVQISDPGIIYKCGGHDYQDGDG